MGEHSRTGVGADAAVDAEAAAAAGVTDAAGGAGHAASAGPAHAALTRRLRAAGCVYAEDEAALLLDAGRGDPVRLRRLVERRVAGEPLEYVLGWVEFGGLRLRVRPGVFVPRSRTLAVVKAAATLIEPGACVIDLCAGVGAIGAALVHEVGALDLIATDIDPEAVEAAAENLGDHGVALCGDLFDSVPERYRGVVDLIAVNAPYVPTAAVQTMPREARDHELLTALDGGSDGLDFHRRIAAVARDWLRPAGPSDAGEPEGAGGAVRAGGAVVVETSRVQAQATADIFAGAGFRVEISEDDDVDGTAVVATLD